MSNVKRSKRKFLLIILAVVILVGGGAGYYFGTKKSVTQTTSNAISYKTSTVKRGNLTLSASGTGSVIASRTTDLSFSSSGNIASINVKVGDKVKEGDVLAELDNKAMLQKDVDVASLNLLAAQQALENLKANAAANLANAAIQVADTKKAYDEAKSEAVNQDMTRCDSDTISTKYNTYLNLQQEVDRLMSTKPNQADYQAIVLPVKDKMDAAYTAYEYCTKFTSYEVDSSQATVELTKAEYDKAQAAKETLKSNNGIDPVDLASAENAVSSAELALEKAKNTLSGVSLKAPFDGTIMSIAGEVGGTINVGTDVTASSFITLADLDHPLVKFYIDETDMDKLAVGQTAEVTFDAIPDTTYTGTVIQVYPALEEVSGYQVLMSVLQLNFKANPKQQTLPTGLNAAVEVVGGKAENAMLIPVEALHDIGDDEYGVFVLKNNGELEFRTVTVGIMDLTQAEIKDGLTMGEVVSTGKVETKQ